MSSFIIEPDTLEELRSNPDIVIVDLCKEKQYKQAHIPGAHFLPYPEIVRIEKPVMGLLPDSEQFSKTLSKLGINNNTHVIAYDDEGGGCASRFIWTLHVFGHSNASLLNGGLFSWANEGHELSNEIPQSKISEYTVSNTEQFTVDREYILQNLDQPDTAFLDARSIQEFTGEKKLADKAGRIPGAIRYEWTDAMDKEKNFRLLPDETIQNTLDELSLTKDKEIICYCQSHHRSALSYLMLRHLGYENVKGYPGAWSDWGNHPDTPAEI